MSKNIKYVCFIWCLGLWIFHVYNLNREYNSRDTYYDTGDVFIYNGLQVKVEECHMFTQDEFMDYFNIVKSECSVFDEYKGDKRVLCLKLSVTNNTYKKIYWQTIFDGLGYGFESDIWCSSCNPMLESIMNVYETEYIDVDDSGTLWRATIVSEGYFKKSFWKNIDNTEFYYLLNIQPNRIRIKLR